MTVGGMRVKSIGVCAERLVFKWTWDLKDQVSCQNSDCHKSNVFSYVFLPFHPNPQMVSTLKLRTAKDMMIEKESREEKVIEGTVPAVSE